MNNLCRTLFAVPLSAGLMCAAQAGEKWDMPMAYAASNFHSATGRRLRRVRHCGDRGRD